ncbi:hypothetical protein DKE41_000720 [Acinetobacter pittii]|nr:hypothetical protein DKE41_000720 [Acinetobacter pittii]
MEKEAVASFFIILIKLLGWLNYSCMARKIIKSRFCALNFKMILNKILIIMVKLKKNHMSCIV